MVDIETVAIVGIGAVAGYLAIRSLKGAGVAMPSIGITMPTIEMPAITMPAITMPTISLEGLKEGLVGFGEQISGGFRAIGEQVGAGISSIGAGVSNIGAGIQAGIGSIGDAARAGVGAISDAVKAGIDAAMGTLSGIGSAVKAGVQKGAEIASWVGPTLVGAKVAGPIGAAVGFVGRAGWELGTRIGEALRGTSTLWEFVNKFGQTVQMRAGSIVDVMKTVGWTKVFDIKGFMEKYKVKVIEVSKL